MNGNGGNTLEGWFPISVRKKQKKHKLVYFRELKNPYGGGGGGLFAGDVENASIEKKQDIIQGL